MPFVKGQAKLPNSGRTGNETQRLKTAKEAFSHVYHELGGDQAFLEWALVPENRGLFYRMYSKMLPVENIITNDSSKPIIVQICEDASRL